MAAGTSPVSTCLLACLLCTSVTSVVGEWTRYCGTQPSARYRAYGHCGTSLADTLATMCHIFGGYNSRTFGKRSAGGPAQHQHQYRQHQQHQLYQQQLAAAISAPPGHQRRGDAAGAEKVNPFWSKSQAYSYLKVQKRVVIAYNGQTYRQGIVCECCMHRCSIGELYEYCADPAYSVAKRRAIDSLGKRARYSGGAPFRTTRSLAADLLAAVNPGAVIKSAGSSAAAASAARAVSGTATKHNNTAFGGKLRRLRLLNLKGPAPGGTGGTSGTGGLVQQTVFDGERIQAGIRSIDEAAAVEAEEEEEGPDGFHHWRREQMEGGGKMMVGKNNNRLAQIISIQQRLQAPRSGSDDVDFDEMDTQDISDRK